MVPVPEVELEVDQTQAARTISTSEASHGADPASVCLAYSNQTHPPTPRERVVLALNNLGEKGVDFPHDGNGAKVHEAIISTFPSLASGYELLRNSEGRRKELLKIPMPGSAFSVDYLRSVLGQAFLSFAWHCIKVLSPSD